MVAKITQFFARLSFGGKTSSNCFLANDALARILKVDYRLGNILDNILDNILSIIYTLPCINRGIKAFEGLRLYLFKERGWLD